MKFTKSIGSLIFAFLVLSCSAEAPNPEPIAEEKPTIEPEPEEPIEPKSEVYFSYYSDPNETLSQWNDNWIILHNQEGEILDYRQFVKGDSLEFNGTEEMLTTVQTLTVTILNYRLGTEGGQHHQMQTSAGISKGAVWGWTGYEQTIPFPPLTNNAQVGITVNNIPNVHWYSLSGLSQNLKAGYPFYRETDVLQIGGVRLYYDINYILSLRDGNDQIRYQFLELPNPASNIVLNYDDFLEYDSVLDIILPEYQSYSIFVDAGLASKNYSANTNIFAESSANQTRSITQLGYIDSFDTFNTVFTLHYNDQTIYSRYKIGAKVTNLNVPADPLFVADGNTVYDFSFTTDQNYYRNTSSWLFQDNERNISTRYVFNGKFDLSALNGGLPDEILENFPDLNLDNLKREQTLLFIGENIDYASDDRQTISGYTFPQDTETIRFKTND